MKRLRLAISFLTIFPVPIKGVLSPSELGRSAGWFPLVGAAIGVLVAAIHSGLSLVFSPLLAAALAAAAWIGLTGGLHLDGLADSCDGMLNASSQERRLEIMKDPRLGTFGGIGLILVILVKFALLYDLPRRSIWFALPLAAATARWMLLPAATQPMARLGGLGAEFSQHTNPRTWLPAACFMGLLTFLSGWHGLLGVLAAHIIAWIIFITAKIRLGGMTGDVFGMTVEFVELVVLVVFCIKV